MPHILYAVGQELVPGQGHYYATLWKDGKRQLLTDGSADSFCNGVYVDGNKVYVVGCEAIGDLFDDGYYEPYPLNVGVMWQFEVGNETQVTRSVLSDGKRATSPVAVAAAGENIYAAGFETLENSDRKAVYWRNGQMEYLSDGSTDALAYCVAAEGNDVYVGGYVQPADNKSGGIACIWKNGVAQNLTDGSTLAKVNAICIDGGVLYAAGAEKVSGGRWKGVLWKDGQPTYFTEEVGTEVTGLYVKEGKYIIEGNMTADSGDIVTCIWTEEGVQSHLRRNGLVPGDGPRRSRKRTSTSRATPTTWTTALTRRSTARPSGKTARKWRSKSSAPTTSPCGGPPAPSSTRKSNSARRPSFARPDTPNATSRYGIRTGTLFPMAQPIRGGRPVRPSRRRPTPATARSPKRAPCRR